MTNTKLSGPVLGASLLSAIAASLCCIIPVIALLAGSSSMLANFSWIELARPYLLAISMAALAFAWYQKLKLNKSDLDCNCQTQSTPFIQSKSFLSIVTVFALLMITFPLYSNIIFPGSNSKAAAGNILNQKKISFTVNGMSCQNCEGEINHALSKVIGVLAYTTSYAKGSSIVTYDPAKADELAIAKAINSTGYTAIKNK